jgi:hypothetical protein
LYLDEDAMQRGLVTALRARWIDILTASDAGMINKSDEDHLRWATREHRLIYSFNMADYALLHRQWVARGQPLKRNHSRLPTTLFRRRTTAAIAAPSEQNDCRGNATPTGVPFRLGNVTDLAAYFDD